jgi:hypothetical protein
MFDEFALIANDDTNSLLEAFDTVCASRSLINNACDFVMSISDLIADLTICGVVSHSTELKMMLSRQKGDEDIIK